VLALGSQGTTLFAGGIITGMIGDNEVNGLVLYDLAAATYASSQPQPFVGPGGSRTVSVNAIAPQPSSTNVYVGGDFVSAASFGCPALCIYDTSRSQWNSPGSGIGGSVAALSWIDNNRLLIGGNLTANGSSAALMTYDSRALTYGAIAGATALPGPITALSPGSSDGSHFWVAGKASNSSAYIEKFDGSKWSSIGHLLGPNSEVRGLQVFTLTDKHGKSDLLNEDQDLMVLGQLNIPSFGNVSAALYNGTNFIPFVLASATNGPGSLSQAFVQNPHNFFKNGGHHLAVGFVVLIALAIALALIFLLVVAGIMAERIRRKREGYVPAPTQMYDKNNNMHRIPPEHLLAGSLGPGQGRSGGYNV